MDLVPYAVPFFLLAILVEYLYGRSRGHDTYRLNDSINSLSLGVLSTSTKLLGLNIGGVVFASASTLAPFALDPASPWTWLAALLLYDFCYYWFHRISHERTLLWASHVAHHQSEEFNLTTALRQTSTGFLLGWVFYIPCFLAGIPASVFVTVASAHLIYQFWIHSRHIPKLGPLEWVLVTASNHRVHHAQNPAYVDRNYGGLLIVWDRLFGTFAEERAEEPCVYGMLGPLRSWNPVWANLHIYAGMLRDARHTGSALDRLRVLVSRTGWRPADVAARFPVHKVPLAGFRRFDPAFTRGVGMYAALQFLVAVVLALWVQETGNDWPMPPLWAAYGYLLLSLFAIGRLLERGGEGCRAEWIRLLVVALVALWVFMTGVAGPAVAPAACLYLLASGLALRTLR
ncbi:MAG: sterol desaturase family protein [Gammaproteobacteria bacterium]